MNTCLIPSKNDILVSLKKICAEGVKIGGAKGKFNIKLMSLFNKLKILQNLKLKLIYYVKPLKSFTELQTLSVNSLITFFL